MARTYIRLTKQEREKLLTRAMELLRLDPDLRPKPLYERSQTVLPAERRRDMAKVNPESYRWVHKEALERLASLPREPDRGSAVEIPEDASPVIQDAPAEDPAEPVAIPPRDEPSPATLAAQIVARIVESRELDRARLDAIEDGMERLGAEISEVVDSVSSFKSLLVNILGELDRYESPKQPAAPPSTVQAAPPESPASRVRLPKVAVVGVLPEQFAAVKARVNGSAELHAYYAADRIDPHTLRSFDYAVFSRFSNHATFERAREAIGRGRVVRVGRGMASAIADEVKRLIGGTDGR